MPQNRLERVNARLIRYKHRNVWTGPKELKLKQCPLTEPSILKLTAEVFRIIIHSLKKKKKKWLNQLLTSSRYIVWYNFISSISTTHSNRILRYPISQRADDLNANHSSGKRNRIWINKNFFNFFKYLLWSRFRYVLNVRSVCITVGTRARGFHRFRM